MLARQRNGFGLALVEKVHPVRRHQRAVGNGHLAQPVGAVAELGYDCGATTSSNRPGSRGR